MSHDFILMEVLRDDWLETGEERLAARFRGMDDAARPTQATAEADIGDGNGATSAEEPPAPRRRSVFPQSGTD
jgi:hypothetical protein